MEIQTSLVLVLGLALLIFVVLGAVLLYFLIKLATKANRVGARAEQVADDLASASRALRRSIKPAVVTSAVTKGLKKVFKADTGSKK